MTRAREDRSPCGLRSSIPSEGEREVRSRYGIVGCWVNVQVPVLLTPATVAVAVYVSVETTAAELERTENCVIPLLVFCGDDVRSVVELPAVRAKLTEKFPAVARLLLLSTI